MFSMSKDLYDRVSVYRSRWTTQVEKSVRFRKRNQAPSYSYLVSNSPQWYSEGITIRSHRTNYSI